MRGPTFATFEQAEDGAPAAVRVDRIVAVWRDIPHARTVIDCAAAGEKFACRYYVREDVATALSRIESVSELDG